MRRVNHPRAHTSLPMGYICVESPELEQTFSLWAFLTPLFGNNFAILQKTRQQSKNQTTIQKTWNISKNQSTRTWYRGGIRLINHPHVGCWCLRRPARDIPRGFRPAGPLLVVEILPVGKKPVGFSKNQSGLVFSGFLNRPLVFCQPARSRQPAGVLRA